jgi:hypothetical protein
MRLENQKQSTVLTTGPANKSIGMSLDLDSAQVLMQMLSKNLYSDAIGSAVRECASNALDSHRRAGVNKPIVVSLVRNDSNNYEFSVEDFGIGLEADDVEKIISKYGKSTKRDSDTELGMMGLGFKAPLAYASSFYFTCRKDGVERKYMMYEGEETNTIDLIYEKPTTEDNGVKIIVPIKWGDRHDFTNKIKEQLAYFEHVYFNVDGIKNDFIIHRSNIFQFSELASDKYLHVCLDDVYYPLDFNKLGIDKIEIPVGLKLSLTDGVFPTPNRESLRYTPEAKKAILEKIQRFANVMTQRYNQSVTVDSDVYAVLKYYTSNSRYVKMFGKDFDYNQLVKFATATLATPTIPGVNTLKLDTLASVAFSSLLSNYRRSYKYENSRMYEIKNDNNWYSRVDWDDPKKRHYLLNGDMRGHKKAYLRELVEDHESRTVYFIKEKAKHKQVTLKGSQGYKELLKLNNYPKDQWRTVIKEWKHIESLLLADLVDADAIEVPQDWLDARNNSKVAKMKATKAAKGAKLEGDFNCKKAEDLLRYNDGRKCKFVAGRLNVQTIEEGDTLYVYTHHDDFLKLDKMYEDTKKMGIQYITLSQRELDVIEDSGETVDNLVSYDNFVKGHEKFVQIVTAVRIHKFCNKYSDVFDKRSFIKEVNLVLATDLKNLTDYRALYLYPARHISFGDLDALMKIAEENNLFDDTYYQLQEKVHQLLKTHYYFNTLAKVMNYSHTSSQLLDCMAQLMTCNGLTVNADYEYNYLKKALKDDAETE